MKSLPTQCYAWCVLVVSALVGQAAPLGTAFTYQGRLFNGTNGATGLYDLRFTLYDSVTGGATVGLARTNGATGVTNGLFTVSLDFGTGIFEGNARWLEIGVRTNGGGAFTTLSPRQPLTPSPYALYAGDASSAYALSGTLPATQLTGTVPLTRLPVAVVTNNASGIALAGTFSGNGAGLTNLDSTKLTGPLALQPALMMGARSTNVSGSAEKVAVSGNYAFVAGGDVVLHVFNISNPANLVTLWSSNNPWNVSSRAVAVSGSYAYVANGSGGLRIFNVSNPAALVSTAATNNGGEAMDLALSGNYLYLANGTDGVRTYYIGNPATPTNASRVNNVGYSHAVTVSGSYLFLANDTNGLRVFSLANPASPTFVASTAPQARAISVAAGGNYAYMGTETNGVHIYNAANPSSLIYAGTIPSTVPVRHIALSGRYAFLACDTEGVRVFDVSNPASPLFVTRAANGGNAMGSAIAGTNVWVANGSDGLRYFSLGLDTLGSIQTGPLATVGIGGTPVDSVLDVEGDMHLNDHDLFFRGGTDRNHGLGWYGSGKTFGSLSPDGPMLYGYSGGGLGSTANGKRTALHWDSGGRVTVDPLSQNYGTYSQYALAFGSNHVAGIASPVSGTLASGLMFKAGNKSALALSPDRDVVVDPEGWNSGSYSCALRFGDVHSGEGIASTRYSGDNVNGLQFYTASLARLSIDSGGHVGLGTMIPEGALLDIEGDARLNDHDLLFRAGTDANHGLGWYGNGKSFNGVNLDGPVLYGCAGGGLGTACSSQKLALRWNSDGTLIVDPTDQNAGTLTGGLIFGNGSGEGIASRRTAGANQHGLDLFTGYTPRISISNGGYVGVGTNDPRFTLHVAGTLGVSLLNYGDYHNVQWNPTSGQLLWDSSSRRYKENIQPLEADFEALLLARPMTYTRPGQPDRWEIGFIAEEFDALGLRPLVEYDAEEKPEGVRYDKVCLYLVEVAKRQETQLQQQATELENLRQQAARIDALEQSVAELKAALQSILNK